MYLGRAAVMVSSGLVSKKVKVDFRGRARLKSCPFGITVLLLGKFQVLYKM